LPREPKGPSDWYKDAIVYEVPVWAFRDSNADGVGDLKGLIEKLDYLAHLGVTALWLLPFYVSPLRDDGYDISDFRAVHPNYGTLRDFEQLVHAAHERGLRIIIELVLNHTSIDHPWFRRARRAPPGHPDRDLYVWSETPHKYAGARVIFRDVERSNWTWDPEAKAYYWHRFYSHQPDLNFESPLVREMIKDTVDFWLERGVDGLRLDAVPYLFEREGTSCENLPETHSWLKELRAYIDERFSGRMLLAEANQWPEDAAEYFGAGDECHMAFNFPVMPRLFMALKMEDAFPIVDIILQTPSIPDSCQWMLFLRNHDELTLEMVTDEERDFMYWGFAEQSHLRLNLGIRRRLAPLLGNNRRTIDLLHGLLFSLPGTPVIYYGDEIGMGDNVHLGDRQAVRTPMQWSDGHNAGFSDGGSDVLYLPIVESPAYRPQVVNVRDQERDPNSLLSNMRRLISVRRNSKALACGSLEFVPSDNDKVLSFVRCHQGEHVLVMANLSRYLQCARLDLSRFEGSVPMESAGRALLPPIASEPYAVTLGPHDFYWLELHPADDRAVEERAAARAERRFDDDPTALLEPGQWTTLAEALAAHLERRPDSPVLGRRLRNLDVVDVLRADGSDAIADLRAALCLLTIDYVSGGPESYVLPLHMKPAEERSDPQSIIVRGPTTVLVEGTREPSMWTAIAKGMERSHKLPGRRGEASVTWAGDEVVQLSRLSPRVLDESENKITVVYGDDMVLRMPVRSGAGNDAGADVGDFLVRHQARHVAEIVGRLSYRSEAGQETVLGLLQHYVVGSISLWQEAVEEFHDYVGAAERGGPSRLSTANALGKALGELHVLLASESGDPAFAPEPFDDFYRRSLLQSSRTQVRRVLGLVRERGWAMESAQRALEEEGRFLAELRAVFELPLGGQRIRSLGHCHLGQFVRRREQVWIVDSQPDPNRRVGERQIKRSPFEDVAGALRSIHYAAFGRAAGLIGARGDSEDREALRRRAERWYRESAAALLRGYLGAAGIRDLLPPSDDHAARLLAALVQQRAFQDLASDLFRRPRWAEIPLTAILETTEFPYPGASSAHESSRA
jgi:maltose alpha-D-glucosyltransferase / alpha-amylase